MANKINKRTKKYMPKLRAEIKRRKENKKWSKWKSKPNREEDGVDDEIENKPGKIF